MRRISVKRMMRKRLHVCEYDDKNNLRTVSVGSFMIYSTGYDDENNPRTAIAGSFMIYSTG